MSEEQLSFKLDQFEGPLDLLLHLIKDSKIDIYDISISAITDQYLDYLVLMEELNLDIAGEYLLMAATLTYIKSRTLVPTYSDDEIDDESDEDDPKAALIRQLAEYRIYREASLSLKTREETAKLSFGRMVDLTEQPDKSDLLIEVGLFELLKAVKTIIGRLDEKEKYFRLKLDAISVTERMNEILTELEGVENITFEQLFKGDDSRAKIIASFLAILELIRLKLLKAKQASAGGAITIHKPLEQEEKKAYLESTSDSSVKLSKA